MTVDDKRFSTILSLLDERNFDGAIDLASRKDISNQSSRITVRNNVAYVDNIRMPDVLSERLVMLFDNRQPVESLLAFWDRLRLNPSTWSVSQLYSFLEASHFAITPEGYFVGYKYTRADYRDNYTGNFLNTPGSTLSMVREDVDSDPDIACSTGLHVGTYEYATEHCGLGRVIEVLVDPADVVSVPKDHSFQKCRVCRYIVIRDVTKKLTDAVVDVTVAETVNNWVVPADAVQLKVSSGRLTVPSTLLKTITGVSAEPHWNIFVGTYNPTNNSTVVGKSISIVFGHKDKNAVVSYPINKRSGLRLTTSFLAKHLGDFITEPSNLYAFIPKDSGTIYIVMDNSNKNS